MLCPEILPSPYYVVRLVNGKAREGSPVLAVPGHDLAESERANRELLVRVALHNRPQLVQRRLFNDRLRLSLRQRNEREKYQTCG